jgi:hypothetical protein
MLPALAAAALLAAGCTDDKKAQNTTTDGGAEQGPAKPVLDGKLAAVVKAAESAKPAASSANAGDGPPENGVFAAGLADKAQPPGAPPKVEVIADGKEPRVLLASASAPTDEQKETASVTLRIQGGAIPVEYALALKVDKAKDDKDKKDAGPRPPGVQVRGKVTAIGLPPQVPHDLGDKLGKLKGTEIRYVIAPNGGATDLGYAVPKDADPGLGEAVVKGLVDAIGVMMPPLPTKPIGAGGYWMVTDRASNFGVEVVRYRVYTVDKIDKDSASFSVQVRQYAAKDDADLGAIASGQKMTLQRFESNGTADLDWTAAGLLPGKGKASQRTSIAGGVSGGQQGMLQAELVARFAAEASDKKK